MKYLLKIKIHPQTDNIHLHYMLIIMILCLFVVCRHAVMQLKVMAALPPPVEGWAALARTEHLSVEEKDVKVLLQPPRLPSNQPRI